MTFLVSGWTDLPYHTKDKGVVRKVSISSLAATWKSSAAIPRTPWSIYGRREEVSRVDAPETEHTDSARSCPSRPARTFRGRRVPVTFGSDLGRRGSL